ncbi:hypothetical protein EW146_g3506 [Bondarzewia mesenterica]|uniref:Uncharacterized protein n=1 Tax=Bondarzewia mesenterica TaxID=1095465 RepID=A0A4S4LZJ7_9AGAM|nr:hypothetical protein EW146_g3506 [Bondarzewia mesenterica]
MPPGITLPPFSTLAPYYRGPPPPDPPSEHVQIRPLSLPPTSSGHRPQSNPTFDANPQSSCTQTSHCPGASELPSNQVRSSRVPITGSFVVMKVKVQGEVCPINDRRATDADRSRQSRAPSSELLNHDHTMTQHTPSHIVPCMPSSAQVTQPSMVNPTVPSNVYASSIRGPIPALSNPGFVLGGNESQAHFQTQGHAAMKTRDKKVETTQTETQIAKESTMSSAMVVGQRMTPSRRLNDLETLLLQWKDSLPSPTRTQTAADLLLEACRLIEDSEQYARVLQSKVIEMERRCAQLVDRDVQRHSILVGAMGEVKRAEEESRGSVIQAPTMGPTRPAPPT